jgi:hypothetical protein
VCELRLVDKDCCICRAITFRIVLCFSVQLSWASAGLAQIDFNRTLASPMIAVSSCVVFDADATALACAGSSGGIAAGGWCGQDALIDHSALHPVR